mmetsp:Transcript_6924/g.42249  ORF Transcript_6924/g.42249 Transcript_6924/m.42249 type:complete len:244 (+) Transcript_6924:6060-6791(+)
MAACARAPKHVVETERRNTCDVHVPKRNEAKRRRYLRVQARVATTTVHICDAGTKRRRFARRGACGTARRCSCANARRRSRTCARCATRARGVGCGRVRACTTIASVRTSLVPAALMRQRNRERQGRCNRRTSGWTTHASFSNTTGSWCKSTCACQRAITRENDRDPARTRFARRRVGPWNFVDVEEGVQVTCVDPNQAHVGRPQRRENARAMRMRWQTRGVVRSYMQSPQTRYSYLGKHARL